MKRLFKQRLLDLGLSYKKEMTIILLVNILVLGLGAAGFYFFKTINKSI